jgi:chromosome segregation ATPase
MRKLIDRLIENKEYEGDLLATCILELHTQINDMRQQLASLQEQHQELRRDFTMFAKYIANCITKLENGADQPPV